MRNIFLILILSLIGNLGFASGNLQTKKLVITASSVVSLAYFEGRILAESLVKINPKACMVVNDTHQGQLPKAGETSEFEVAGDQCPIYYSEKFEMKETDQNGTHGLAWIKLEGAQQKSQKGQVNYNYKGDFSYQDMGNERLVEFVGAGRMQVLDSATVIINTKGRAQTKLGEPYKLNFIMYDTTATLNNKDYVVGLRYQEIMGKYPIVQIDGVRVSQKEWDEMFPVRK